MADIKILVVDDDEGIRRVLYMSLSESGYRVLTAGTGSCAIEMLRSERPAIVLADIKMPDVDGIELLQKIKEENPHTEVIMMTGHPDRELARNCLRHDAADFIAKPINYDALEIALKRVHEKIMTRSPYFSDTLERLDWSAKRLGSLYKPPKGRH